MKFTSFIPASLLAASVAAAPVAKGNSAFTVISARSGSPIHLQAINAAGSKFWVGGSPATFCPSFVNPCPPGNETVWANAFNMDVEVPGGQTLYVAPSGALSFTTAHSMSMPAGSQQGPFDNQQPSSGEEFGTYTTSSFGATGFMACPDDATNASSWQVFAAIRNATVPTGNVDDCLGFDALTTSYTGSIPTWEYT
ncbi:IgE-binding protein [Talaromyces proteolyticus]|uniref:IgE-binding protein n=1 Tax=Talaromyces proteolyticus TaxID=1131652 RepID=A0AAD4PYJ7_9EURO|nr:IgE-binding protein [Talaromyces proteolyticus]KAH8695233.1 IgE-binding protein [Talaromyces proteolyticus]